MKLDVPLADLAVHEPDHKRLIAFLKAMEFSTLTRRVAEFSGVDAAEIEPDATLGGRGGAPPRLRLRARSAGEAAGRGAARASLPAASPDPPPQAGRERTEQRPAAERSRHAAVARRRARRALRKLPSSTARATRSCARPTGCKAWVARAHRPRHRRDRHRDHQPRPDAGGAVRHLARARAERGLLRAARAPQGRRRRQRRPVRRRPRARPDPGARPRSPALKPLLEDRGVLKIGQNLKFDLADLRAARHRDRVLRRHHADVLRARRRPRRPRPRRAAAALLRSHRRSTTTTLIGTGKRRVAFDCVDDRQGRRICRRGRRRDAAAVAGAQAAPRRRAHDHRLRDAGAAAAPVLARMERRGISIDRQVLSRLSGEFAQRAAGARSRDPRARRRAASIPAARSSSATSCSARCGLPGGTKTKTGQWSTGARVLDELAEQGHAAAAEDSRLAAGHEAEIDLHRRAAGLRQSDDPPRAHELRARRDHDRPALVVRAEPAEHPDPHRGGPQDPPRLHRRRRATSSSPPTIRRSSCGCSPRSPTSRRCARRSATASTSTP